MSSSFFDIERARIGLGLVTASAVAIVVFIAVSVAGLIPEAIWKRMCGGERMMRVFGWNIVWTARKMPSTRSHIIECLSRKRRRSSGDDVGKFVQLAFRGTVAVILSVIFGFSISSTANEGWDRVTTIPHWSWFVYNTNWSFMNFWMFFVVATVITIVDLVRESKEKEEDEEGQGNSVKSIPTAVDDVNGSGVAAMTPTTRGKGESRRRERGTSEEEEAAWRKRVEVWLWITLETTATAELSVAVLFWAFLVGMGCGPAHNCELKWTTFFVHGINVVIAVCEMMLDGFEWKPMHFVFPGAFIALWEILTGGLFWATRIFVYDTVQNPNRAMAVVAIGFYPFFIVFFIVFFFVMFGIDRIMFRAFKRKALAIEREESRDVETVPKEVIEIEVVEMK